MAPERHQMIRRSEFLWEIPRETRKDMRVPAHIFAVDSLLDSLLRDKSLDQLMNVAALPGIEKAAMVMPDAHEGYGFPIGGIAATLWPHGAISPGGIGYDINCGVRLLSTKLNYQEVRNRAEELSKELFRNIPSGVGKGGTIRLNHTEMNRVLAGGSHWAVDNGYGDEEDLARTESGGKLVDADPALVSEQARERGKDQLGTIGSGNHFAEAGRVSQIFDEKTAAAYGLHQDQVVILIHTGSRGLGHQVATDYIRLMLQAMKKYDITVPDRELACVPFSSEEGRNYFSAMCAAANFAWCNRQVITSEIRKAWKNVFGEAGAEVRVVYDVAHNIAKIEDHLTGGKTKKLIVHRKGATRAFGPGFQELPEAYRKYGQPVLIPGSMGTCSYVLAGAEASMEHSFGSACHGAGRRLSRRKAAREVKPRQLMDELKQQGIYIQAGSHRGIAEEAPVAYKDVDLVVDTVHRAGIARKVAKLKPIVVIKG